MKRTKLILAALAASIAIVGISTVLPTQTRPQPASASDAAKECPAPTDKGVYFERGRDKDGNALCGFAYYNPCPYFEAAEAGTPECEKGKPTEEQLKPWNPNESVSNPTSPTTPELKQPVNTCGGSK